MKIPTTTPRRRRRTLRATLVMLIGTLAFSFLPGVPRAEADTFSAPFPATPATLGAIPDSPNSTCGTQFGRRDVSVPVAGLPTGRRITDVYVGTNFSHTFASDLVIDLVPPGSTYPTGGQPYVRLFGTLNCTPNSGADFNGGYGFQTGTANLPAAIAAAGSGVIPGGNYAPRDSFSSLSNIFNPNGVWKVIFWDSDQGGTGTVNALDLRIMQDTTAPGVTINSGPANEATVNSNPTYTFSSSANDLLRFECSQDGGAFAPCTSPRTLNLGLGVHTFRVRGVDTSGNFSTPVQRQYNQVANPPPDTEITSGPADGSTVSSSPTFVFGSPDSDILRFECRLDGGGWSTCTSPRSEPSTGAHTFEVRAVDLAGQVDGTPAARSYTYTPVAPDTTAPQTQISSGPADGARVKQPPTYGFTSPDSDTEGFECSVDGGTYEPCASPYQVAVAPGPHTFAVRAYDEVPNVDATPATRSFILRDLCQEARTKLQAAKQRLRNAIQDDAGPRKIRRLRAAVRRWRAAVNDLC